MVRVVYYTDWQGSDASKERAPAQEDAQAFEEEFLRTAPGAVT